MNSDYGALRLWSTVLVLIGIAGGIFVVTGRIFASWPKDVGQGLRGMAAVADYVRD